MNGPLKFLTARKILPLLDLLATFKRRLACLCSPNFCVVRKLAKQFFISARARKKIAVFGMLANARKDDSSPLVVSMQQNSHGLLFTMSLKINDAISSLIVLSTRFDLQSSSSDSFVSMTVECKPLAFQSGDKIFQVQ